MPLDQMSSLWIGDRLSCLERMSIVSFLRVGHPYDLYVYSNIEGIPDGVNVKDARSILPESDIFCYENGSPAAFANLFRYALLRDRDSWWVDTDVICLKPFVFDAPVVIGAQNGAEAWDWVNNAVLRLPAKEADELYQLAKAKGRNVSWGQCGPILLTSFVKSHNWHGYVQGRDVFYPVPWGSWRDLYEGAKGIPIHGAHALHLWNEMLRKNCMDKYADYPTTSVYQQLRERLLGK